MLLVIGNGAMVGVGAPEFVPSARLPPQPATTNTKTVMRQVLSSNRGLRS